MGANHGNVSNDSYLSFSYWIVEKLRSNDNSFGYEEVFITFLSINYIDFKSIDEIIMYK